MIVTQRKSSIRRAVSSSPGTVRYWLHLTLRVARLAADRRSHIKLLLRGVVMPLRDRLLGPRSTKVRLRYRNIEVDWILGPKSDLEVLDEVLLYEEYGEVPVTSPDVIVDLGAHTGVSLLYLRAAYPTARLIGVEPDPLNFKRLRRNVSQLDRVEVHQLALAERDADVPFFSAEQGWVSSRDGDGRLIWVTGRTLDSLLDELTLESVDLLKIDIEGGEMALAGSRRLLDVEVVVGELHDHGSPTRRDRLLSVFKGFDLRVRGRVGEHATFVATRQPL
jgi:FkbM family methyltransferase